MKMKKRIVAASWKLFGQQVGAFAWGTMWQCKQITSAMMQKMTEQLSVDTLSQLCARGCAMMQNTIQPLVATLSQLCAQILIDTPF